MDKLNVVNLKEFKELKQTSSNEDSYGRYLKTLENGQLDAEIHFLKDEACNKTFISKGKILSEEIASRADGDWKRRIELLNQDTLKLL